MLNIKAVIGANWGDEGKGMMTDYFAHEAIKKGEKCIVVCTNGGAQRGHTVETSDGIRHVFHHFGSGTIAGTSTYLSHNYIVNPMEFRREYQELEQLGIKPVVYVHPSCLWTCPFDMIINQIVEESRGENKHGSCGMGIWETICRYKMESISSTVSFVKNNSCLDLVERLKQYRDIKLPARLQEYGITEVPDKWKVIINSGGLIEHYIDDFQFFFDHVEITGYAMLNDFDSIVFENGQGLLLDYDENEKHSTPSHTGLQNVKEILEIGIIKEFNLEVCYVTRSYLTRHGAGPFSGECKKEDINSSMVDETNVPNPFQGTLRYGKLDYNELFKRCEKDFDRYGTPDWSMSLAITHLNEYDCPDIYKAKFNYLSGGKERESVKIASEVVKMTEG